MCEKGIVVRLERIPVVEISRLSAQTSLKIRKSRYHYLRRASPRHTAQRWVRRQRINRFDSLIVCHAISVEAESNGIHKAGAENVGLFQSDDVSICMRAIQYIVHGVGVRERSIVVQ